MSLATRNPRIDVLRGISITLVLLLHFTLSYRLWASPLARIVPASFLRTLTLNGNFGVTMFFAISGFLITSMSMERFGSLANIKARAFYVFRFARIMPSLLLALTLIVLLSCTGLKIFMNGGEHGLLPVSSYFTVLLSVLTFWHNVLMAYRGYFNYCVNIYWSLSVEEVFYLCFPFACILLKRKRLLLGLCALAILAGPIYRHQHPSNDIEYLYAYLACFDAIAMGCAAAILAQSFPQALSGKAGRILQPAAALLVGLVYLRGIHGHVVLGFTFIALGTAILLMGSGHSAQGRVSSSPLLGWLRWLGRHSYELYLFHIIILALMREIVRPGHLPDGWKPAWLVLFLILSALTAWGIARFWSEPLNRKGRNWLA